MRLIDVRVVVFAIDVVHVNVSDSSEPALSFVIAVIPGSSVVKVHGVSAAAHVQRGCDTAIERAARCFCDLDPAELRSIGTVAGGIDTPAGGVRSEGAGIDVALPRHLYRV